MQMVMRIGCTGKSPIGEVTHKTLYPLLAGMLKALLLCHIKIFINVLNLTLKSN